MISITNPYRTHAFDAACNLLNLTMVLPTSSQPPPTPVEPLTVRLYPLTGAMMNKYLAKFHDDMRQIPRLTPTNSALYYKDFSFTDLSRTVELTYTQYSSVPIQFQAGEKTCVFFDECGRVWRTFTVCPICKTDPINTDGSYKLCRECERNWYVCYECGRACRKDAAHNSSATHGHKLCLTCERWTKQRQTEAQSGSHRDNVRSQVWSYHRRPEFGFVFLSTDSSNTRPTSNDLYLGVELETDDYQRPNKASSLLQRISHSGGLFYLNNDSSLGNGFEIISQPATLEYHQTQFPWAQITKIVKSQGGQSHRTTTCGLHVHASRCIFNMSPEGEDVHLLKLCALYERFWQPLVAFSRRDWHQLAHYGRKIGFSTFGLTADEISQLKRRIPRHSCINLLNAHTIEFRLFKGTLRVGTLLATIELVDHTMRWCVAHTAQEALSVSWAEFIESAPRDKYPNLHEYIELRQIDEEGNYVYHTRKA